MFNDQIDHLYATVMGERSWYSFLERLVRDVPDGKATLQMYDCHHPENSFVAMQTGFDSSALTAYGSHYAKLNLLQQSLAGRPNGVAFADDVLVPQTIQTRDSFFNEWLLPNDVRSSAGIKINASGARAVSLVLLSGRTDAVSRRQMTETLNGLAPHLRRVSEFYSRRDLVQQRAATERDMLGQFGTGMLLLKSDGHIGFINAAARQLLESRTSVLCVASSRLQIRDRELAEIVSAMMKEVCPKKGSIDYYTPGLKITLLRPEQDNMEALFNGAQLIVLITGIASQPPRFDRKLLAQAFGLTAAEMRAVDGLVAGRSAAEMASAAGLSRETIRAQIRSLYAKTGSHSQADIIRLIRPR